MNNIGTDHDTNSRNLIVSEIHQNFFVEAGAGSGKTTMLVSRMDAMVEEGIDIRKICAITFTKAAAAEFYERFQKLLIERSNPDYVWVDTGHAGQLPEPTPETRRLCAQALQDIDLCFMGTIDSFCSMVLSEHPSEAHIPSDATIVSDQEAEVFYKQMYVKICSGEYGENLAEMSRMFRAFHRNAEDVFVEGETVIMGNRNVYFHYPRTEYTDIDREFAEDRQEVLHALECLIAHPELKEEGKKDSREAWENIQNIYKTLRKTWSYNISGILYALKQFGNLRVKKDALDDYGPSLGGLFVPGGSKGKWLECNVCAEKGVYTRLIDLRYSVSMTFLQECVPVLEKAMRDKGYMTFFDCLYYLRNMLRDDAEAEGKLIRYIYDRHSYFLIDEFQDTNPMQAEIFFYLSSEHPVPQWYDCVPRQGSLFIVGDPKQSIYRFRSADVASFLRVKELFEKCGGEILSLSRNFRSTREVCRYFNRVFTDLLPEQTINQSKYEEIPLTDKTTKDFQGIYTYTAYTGKAIEEHSDETDPLQIGRIIDTLVDNEKYTITTKEDKIPRKIRYSDIMVITYGKNKLGPIMDALDARGIPVKVEGKVLFNANEALQETYKIYAAAADADDEIALYGALTGKLIGLSKEEIIRYKDNGGIVSLRAEFNPEVCQDNTTLHVAEKITALRDLCQKAQKLSPAALFTRVMEEYRIYETVEADNLEVICYTLELLRDAERSGEVVSLKNGSAYITDLLADMSDKERCLSLNDTLDAVHMANLHKVKGLEAPVVILAASPTFNRANEIRIVHGERTEGYLFSLPRRNANGSYFETKLYEEQKEEEKEASKAEVQRLIYVAATRARNTLIICDSIGAKDRHDSVWNPIMKEYELPDFFRYITREDVREQEIPETENAAELYETAEKESALNNHHAERATYHIANPSRQTISSKMKDSQEIIVSEDTEELSGVHRFPALLGSMTHKLMEMLVVTKNRISIEVAVAEILGEYLTEETRPYEEDLADALRSVAQKMRTGGYLQDNGLPQDMLNTLLQAEEVYCEVPFSYTDVTRKGNTLWNGVMDVIYCTEGKWHILDYKTNADGSDLDQRYLAQMSAYTKAFRMITGEEADALTYHIDI